MLDFADDMGLWFCPVPVNVGPRIDGTLRDDPEDPEDDRSQPLDYGFKDWTTQDDVLASLTDDAGDWITGEDLGDTTTGEALTQRHCGSCHTPDDSDAPVFYSLAGITTQTLVQRIRRASVGDESSPNDRMPRIPYDRLSDGDLLDLVAFLSL